MLLGSIALAACSLFVADDRSASRDKQQILASESGSLVVGTVLFVNRESAKITIRRIDLLGRKPVQVVSYRLSHRSLDRDLRPGDRVMGTVLSADGTIEVKKHSRPNQADIK